MKTLVIIPARGGSKGIIKKNIKKFNGFPLIYYSIMQARELFDDIDICVSTDSLEIIHYVESLGLQVPFIRPEELSGDKSSTNDVIMHALNFYKCNDVTYDAVLVLQPTSPLRSVNQIKESISIFKKEINEIDMLVSVKETESNPYYVLFEENNDGFLVKSKEGEFLSRQECPIVYEFNGAIYIYKVHSLMRNRISSLKKIRKYVMNQFQSIDIDTELDFEIAEFLLSKKKYFE